MGVRQCPQPDGGRVETGPVQFGDDWPGLFVRGDNAGWLQVLVGIVCDELEEATGEKSFNAMQLRGLIDGAMAGVIVGPANQPR